MKKNRCGIWGILALALIFAAAMTACGGKAQANSGGGNAADGGSSGGGGISAAAALKAFQQTVERNGKTVPNVDAIVKAAQALSGAALTQITQQNGSPSGDFTYDLAADGKGIAIREYTKKPRGPVVIVPETIEDIPVTEIRDKAFSGLHNGKYGIVAVVLPATIVRIGDKAFEDNETLTSINFPAGLKTIGEWAFFNTKLTSVILPEGLKTIGFKAFAVTALTEVVIPEGVETISDAFSACRSLLKVTFPSTIKEIAGFNDCTELADVVIPDSVTSIDWGEDSFAFKGCGKLKLAVRQRLKDLGYKGSFN